MNIIAKNKKTGGGMGGWVGGGMGGGMAGRRGQRGSIDLARLSSKKKRENLRSLLLRRKKKFFFYMYDVNVEQKIKKCSTIHY
jgi:hypothetical protein